MGTISVALESGNLCTKEIQEHPFSVCSAFSRRPVAYYLLRYKLAFESPIRIRARQIYLQSFRFDSFPNYAFNACPPQKLLRGDGSREEDKGDKIISGNRKLPSIGCDVFPSWKVK